MAGLAYQAPGAGAPVRPKKQRVRPLGIAIIIVIAIVGVFAYLNFFPPVTPDRQPTASEYTAVGQSLAEGARMDLAAPERNKWNAGDVGIFNLGIKNIYDSQKTFYVNIYLDELRRELEGTPISSMKDAESWFAYPKSAAMAPNEAENLTITMRIPADALAGSYGFRIIVCTSSECDKNAEELYDSTIIYIRVRD